MAEQTARTSGALGRPRRFDPETEVRVLLQAAFEVMRRNGYEDASVAEILEEAGLSTRSFYRNFQSKDDLVLALFRANAEAASQRLESRVAAAAAPREGLEAWMDEILSFRLQPPQVRAGSVARLDWCPPRRRLQRRRARGETSSCRTAGPGAQSGVGRWQFSEGYARVGCRHDPRHRLGGH